MAGSIVVNNCLLPCTRGIIIHCEELHEHCTFTVHEQVFHKITSKDLNVYTYYANTTALCWIVKNVCAAMDVSLGIEEGSEICSLIRLIATQAKIANQKG